MNRTKPGKKKQRGLLRTLCQRTTSTYSGILFITANIDILHQTSDGKLYRKRSTNLHLATISAMLYDHAEKQRVKLLQMRDVITRPGLPGVMFNMDETTLRQLVEDLHKHGWVRYEGTHNLDQIRLKEDFRALDFLTAYYKGADPQPSG